MLDGYRWYHAEVGVSDVGRTVLDGGHREWTHGNTEIGLMEYKKSDSSKKKETRESETWLHMLSDNGYLDSRMGESILNDCARINKILIIITAKVRKRLSGGKE